MGTQGDIELFYVACPGGGKHIMTPHSFGIHPLTSGGTFKGYLFQCKNCYMTATTVNNYFNVNERKLGPGKYILSSIPYYLDQYTSYTFTNKGTLIGPLSSWGADIFGSMEFRTS